MANNYARLSHVKADIAGVSGTTLDSVLERQIEQASREFDSDSQTQFFAELGTFYFEAQPDHMDRTRLLLPFPVISITSLKSDTDGDYSYSDTLVVSTDYFLIPNNPGQHRPYTAIQLNSLGTQIGEWPAGYRRIQLVGVRGYSYETEAIVAAGTPVTGTLSNAADLTLACSADVAALIFPGDTIVLGSEQMPVASVSTSTVTLASRGLNGTTAAAHTDAAVTIRRFPRDVERAVAERVVSARWQSQSGYDAGAAMTGDFSGRAAFARWMKTANHYNPCPLGIG